MRRGVRIAAELAPEHCRLTFSSYSRMTSAARRALSLTRLVKENTRPYEWSEKAAIETKKKIHAKKPPMGSSEVPATCQRLACSGEKTLIRASKEGQGSEQIRLLYRADRWSLLTRLS